MPTDDSVPQEGISTFFLNKLSNSQGRNPTNAKQITIVDVKSDTDEQTNEKDSLIMVNKAQFSGEMTQVKKVTICEKENQDTSTEYTNTVSRRKTRGKGPQQQLQNANVGNSENMDLNEKQEKSSSGSKSHELRKERELKKKREKEERELKKQKEREQRELKKQQEREERELKKQREKEEREARKQREKEERELRKQKEKQQREERKQQEKEEERRRKEEERLKAEEERRKEEEAKERAQSRIGKFFKKASVTKSIVDSKSDYEKTFLPFYVKRDVKISETVQLNKQDLSERIKAIDSIIDNKDPGYVTSWFKSHADTSFGHDIEYTAVEVMQQMTSKTKTEEEFHIMLSRVPQKFIKFYENIRPPYIGTYSKKVKLPTEDPFSTDHTGFNYDYDSDLDWVDQDGEVGDEVEDLENDDDEHDDEHDEHDIDDEDEFDGFLDKDDDSNDSLKAKFRGPLIPTVLLSKDFSTFDEADQRYFNLVSVEYLIEDQPFPIDPTVKSTKRPRSKETTSSTVTESKEVSPKKAKSIIAHPQDLLKVFENVHESSFSLGTVSEIIQKHIPQYSKETIKNTVKLYAERSSGKGNSVRKWTIKDTQNWDSLKNEV
ncbi:HHL176Cp [Eremothecium sinecaudum]|uniref:HHL176Cp n=1 Tax=Eremothecium sinecaudum TaxID=45286 RepID=A0A0X8HW50_9SACH|nr:HHL176Cp [Eremothecium sinecaudum]AMD22594.1 HHL176Cp [Eremothecium sinecaudum]